MAGRAGKERNPIISTTGEKVRFALGDVGCNLVWGFAGSYLTLYYTDSVYMAAGVAGMIMMVARLLDGLSDILMGIIIEKTHSKMGKARPWILWMTLPLIISFMMAFHVPAGFSTGAKTIYMAITYTVLSAVTYTAVNMAYITLFTLFAPDSNDRNVAAAFRTMFAMVAALAVSVVSMPLLSAFGGEHSQAAWDRVALIYSVILLACLAVTFLGVREKKLQKVADDIQKRREKKPIKEVFLTLAKSKYFYIAAFLSVAYYLCNGVGGVNVYYARDILGDANLVGVMGIITLPSMVIGSILAPILYKKFGKRNVMMSGALITAASAALQLLNPRSLVWFLAFSALKGLGVMLYGAAIGTLPGDVADWSEWKQGERAEGIVTSVGSFGSKLGVGFGAGLVGLILAVGGYDGAAVVQSASALQAEIILMIVMPIALGILQFLLLLLWDMDKVRPRIMKELEERRGMTQ